MHIQGRWWQASFGMDLLGERHGFLKGGQGYWGHNSRWTWDQLGIPERSRHRCPFTSACKGTPLTDRIHPHGRGMPGRGRGWPAPRPEAFRPMFPDRRPYQPRTRASWLGGDRTRGRLGRPSHTPFLFPLIRGRISRRDLYPPSPRDPTGDASVSLSLLMHTHGLIGGMARIPS
jgi:ribosome modulation factor